MRGVASMSCVPSAGTSSSRAAAEISVLTLSLILGMKFHGHLTEDYLTLWI